jgi:Methyltransferase domain
MQEFHENWYSDFQLNELTKLVSEVIDLPGVFVEVGCWEGRSTVQIAAACAPQPLHAIDHWLGNVDEGADHPSVLAVADRDVYSTFLRNIAPFPHVVVHRSSGEEAFSNWDLPVKFAHVDVGHTYEATSQVIDVLLPHMVPNGIVCGDDYLESHVGRRDLHGGVQRAVGERLPYHSVVGNLWFWRTVERRFSIGMAF